MQVPSDVFINVKRANYHYYVGLRYNRLGNGAMLLLNTMANAYLRIIDFAFMGLGVKPPVGIPEKLRILKKKSPIFEQLPEEALLIIDLAEMQYEAQHEHSRDFYLLFRLEGKLLKVDLDKFQLWVENLKKFVYSIDTSSSGAKEVHQ